MSLLFFNGIARNLTVNTEREALLEEINNLLAQGRIFITAANQLPNVDLVSLDDPSVMSCIRTLQAALQVTDKVNNKAMPTGSRGDKEQDISFCAFQDATRSAHAQLNKLHELMGNDRHSRSRAAMEHYLELTWA